MTTYLGGAPFPSVLDEFEPWKPLPKKVHACKALDAARGEVWVEHKQQHAEDYRLFADTWPAQKRAELGVGT